MFAAVLLPLNLICTNNFTFGLFLAFLLSTLGWTCAVTTRKVILAGVISIIALLVGLMLLAFGAERIGINFKFIGTFLYGANIAIWLDQLVQSMADRQRHSNRSRFTLLTYGVVSTMVMCGYVLGDMHQLIKGDLSYGDISPAVSLFLHIISLLISLLNFFKYAYAYLIEN